MSLSDAGVARPGTTRPGTAGGDTGTGWDAGCGGGSPRPRWNGCHSSLLLPDGVEAGVPVEPGRVGRRLPAGAEKVGHRPLRADVQLVAVLVEQAPGPGSGVALLPSGVGPPELR